MRASKAPLSCPLLLEGPAAAFGAPEVAAGSTTETLGVLLLPALLGVEASEPLARHRVVLTSLLPVWCCLLQLRGTLVRAGRTRRSVSAWHTPLFRSSMLVTLGLELNRYCCWWFLVAHKEMQDRHDKS